jgi:hypothetical protein
MSPDVTKNYPREIRAATTARVDVALAARLIELERSLVGTEDVEKTRRRWLLEVSAWWLLALILWICVRLWL